MAKTLLITRPQEAAEALSKRVSDLGWASVISPVLTIEALDEVPDLQDGETLIFTSRNGVESFARASTRRDRPALCVGNATAHCATQVGFRAETGPGTVAGLISHLADRPRANFLHIRGEHTTGDLVGAIRAHGHQAREHVQYRQRTTDLTEEAKQALEAREISAIAVFSPRSGRAILDQTRAFREALPPMLCLSQAVADSLRDDLKTPVFWAESPDLEGFLSMLAGFDPA